MTSQRCAAWHAARPVDRGAVIVAACGHPLAGVMSRVLVARLPSADRAVCSLCLAVTGERPDLPGEDGDSELVEWPSRDPDERSEFRERPPEDAAGRVGLGRSCPE